MEELIRMCSHRKSNRLTPSMAKAIFSLAGLVAHEQPFDGV